MLSAPFPAQTLARIGSSFHEIQRRRAEVDSDDPGAVLSYVEDDVVAFLTSVEAIFEAVRLLM